jgi:putative hydrolase of the HAD superfamily
LRTIRVIAFDADDTLWENETLYEATQESYRALLAPYCSSDGLLDELFETEMQNLSLYGYGIKSFTLSMIETAIRVSQDKIRGHEVLKIIELGKEMRRAPIRLLAHVANVVPALADSYPLMLITKGDLLDQEAKVAGSGLAPYFQQIEVVSEKTPEAYQALLDRHQIEPGEFLMVGNSLRSDVLPVVSLGGLAVHIPHHVTWAHEDVAVQPEQSAGYVHLEHIGHLPQFVAGLQRENP